MKIRFDKYVEGDLVSFRSDDRLDKTIPEKFKEKHGSGPFKVEKIRPVFSSSLRSAGHTQHLIIHGESWSGAWFEEIER